MKTNFLKKIEGNNLPIHVFGNGEATHLIVGKIVRADGRELDAVCIICEPYNPISSDFENRLKSVGCQCGKQKTEGFPLCGLCFSNLPNGIKTALRQNKGSALENTYNFAVKSLREVTRK